MFTESTGTVFTKITESAALRRETETCANRLPENCASGFLLDWLAGADACPRSIPVRIEGFSFKFENLGVASPQ